MLLFNSIKIKKLSNPLYIMVLLCYNINVERREKMLGISNIKDFLETVAYVVAIVLGIQEILNNRKGK